MPLKVSTQEMAEDQISTCDETSLTEEGSLSTRHDSDGDESKPPNAKSYCRGEIEDAQKALVIYAIVNSSLTSRQSPGGWELLRSDSILSRPELGVAQSHTSSEMSYVSEDSQSRLPGALEVASVLPIAKQRKQEGSLDSVTLDNRDPDALDVMLNFVYTLEASSLKLGWVDEVDFQKTMDIYDKIPSECEHLASVMALAVEYDIRDLADLAKERLSERLFPLMSHAPTDTEMLRTLTCRLVKVLYSHHDIGLLQTYREVIARMLVDHWDQLAWSDATKDLIRAHPDLAWDMTKLAVADTQKQHETIESMKLDIPKKKRKKYDSPDFPKTKVPKLESSDS